MTRQGVAESFGHIGGSFVGGHAHRLVIVLNHVFYVCAVGTFAKHNPDAWILMWFAYIVVKQAQVAVQFAEIDLLELASLQFDSHEAVQLTVEKQQVDAMIMSSHRDGVLVFDKQEFLAEAEDELLDIVNDFFVQLQTRSLLRCRGRKGKCKTNVAPATCIEPEYCSDG